MKRDWRAAKLANKIWNDHGVDTTFYETLIKSWLNPCHRLLDEYYVPHLTYSPPSENMYWDIPLSHTRIYSKVFKDFDIQIPDYKIFPMEFERLTLFHNKHEKAHVNEIRSNDILEVVTNYKPRSFLKA